MKIWLLLSTLDNMIVDVVDGLTLRDINGSIKNEWRTPNLKVTKKGKTNNYVYLSGGMPLFNQKSLEVLEKILSGHVQLLDVNVINHDINIKLINVINVIDAVDYTRSIPERTLTGKIKGFEKMNFLKHEVEKQVIFKIPEFPFTRVYVSDQFRDLVLSSKLKGFDFMEAWDSEWTEEKEQEEQERYLAFLSELDKAKGPEFFWSQAIEAVESGKAVASGEWKMQNDDKGILHIAKLCSDCNYVWSKSVIVPPILFNLKWHEVEKSEL